MLPARWRRLRVHRHGDVVVAVPADPAGKLHLLPGSLPEPATSDDHLVGLVVVGDILSLLVGQKTEANGEPRRHGVDVESLDDAVRGRVFRG